MQGAEARQNAGSSIFYTPIHLGRDRTEVTWDLQPSRCGPSSDLSLRSYVTLGGKPPTPSLTTCKVEGIVVTAVLSHSVDMGHLAWGSAVFPTDSVLPLRR